MRVLYYDCFSGISGDMNLGAMVDLGIAPHYLIDELSKLKLDEYEIKICKDSKMGIEGTRVDVILKEDHHHEHEHSHRNLQDINEMIMKSDLNNRVKNLSLDIFMQVAKAEGKIHGKPINQVHFHEVGAVDSIVDIVGAAICIDALKPDKIICSTVEVGSGFVKCAHGILPVPAPATAEILKGIPTKSEKVPFEATTPTGAAILSTLVNKFTDSKSFVTHKIGYGVGKKNGNIPNMLRVFLGEELEEESSDKLESEEYIIECNIDDMNPEGYEYILELLLKKGAKDVYLTPIIMKKSRPAVKLSVLCSSEVEDEIKTIIFKETPTLGVRKYKVEKFMLERKYDKVITSYGEVSVKLAFYKGNLLKHKFEYEDCKTLARNNGVSLSSIYEEAEKVFNMNMNLPQ